MTIAAVWHWPTTSHHSPVTLQADDGDDRTSKSMIYNRTNIMRALWRVQRAGSHPHIVGVLAKRLLMVIEFRLASPGHLRPELQPLRGASSELKPHRVMSLS